MNREETIKKLVEKIQAENDGNHADYVLPGYVSKKLKACQSMREELIFCQKAAKYLLVYTFDNVVTTALYHSIIILYGKCFTDASNSQSTKLEMKDCFTEEEVVLLETHKEIMHLRHNFVAHRGSTEHEISFPYLKLNVEDLSRQVKVKQVKRIMPSKDDLKRYILLFEHLTKIVEKKFEKEGNKMWTHMLENFTPQEMAFFIVAGPKKREE